MESPGGEGDETEHAAIPSDIIDISASDSRILSEVDAVDVNGSVDSVLKTGLELTADTRLPEHRTANYARLEGFGGVTGPEFDPSQSTQRAPPITPSQLQALAAGWSRFGTSSSSGVSLTPVDDSSFQSASHNDVYDQSNVTNDDNSEDNAGSHVEYGEDEAIDSDREGESGESLAITVVRNELSVKADTNLGHEIEETPWLNSDHLEVNNTLQTQNSGKASDMPPPAVSTRPHNVVLMTPTRAEYSEELSQPSKGRNVTHSTPVRSSPIKQRALSPYLRASIKHSVRSYQGNSITLIGPGPQGRWVPYRCALTTWENVDRTANPKQEVSVQRIDHEATCPAGRLWPLQLAQGDQVLLDLKGFRGKIYVVDSVLQSTDASLQAGVSSQNDEEELKLPEGNLLKLRLAKKGGTDADTRVVGIADLYMTQAVFTDWLRKYDPENVNHMQDRTYNNLVRSRRRPSISIYDTSPEVSDNEKDVHRGPGNIASRSTDSTNIKRPRTALSSGPLSGCIFTVSSVPPEITDTVQRQIEQAGGTVSSYGLSEFVDVVDAKVTSWDFGSARFMAVLAPVHVRTSKYLEMVACGWPCLHYKYVQACVDNGKLIEFTPYLLSAGRSDVLEVADPDAVVNISADVSKFLVLLQNGRSDLNEQFRQRKLTLELRTPIYYLNLPLESREEVERVRKNRFLLALITRTAQPVDSIKVAPLGSVILDLTDASKEFAPTPTSSLIELEKYAALPSSILKNPAWMHESIINGRPV